jgi:hypothetical protein
MNQFFMSAALVALLSTSAFAEDRQVSPVNPNSADSVKSFALSWFEHLQAGQVDRAQMTTTLSETLTSESVAEMSRYIKSYGPATGDEITQHRKIQDQTFYVVKLFLERGDALSLLMGFDDNGKITGVTFPSMGQE